MVSLLTWEYSSPNSCIDVVPTVFPPAPTILSSTHSSQALMCPSHQTGKHISSPHFLQPLSSIWCWCWCLLLPPNALLPELPGHLSALFASNTLVAASHSLLLGRPQRLILVSLHTHPLDSLIESRGFKCALHAEVSQISSSVSTSSWTPHSYLIPTKRLYIPNKHLKSVSLFPCPPSTIHIPKSFLFF